MAQFHSTHTTDRVSNKAASNITERQQASLEVDAQLAAEVEGERLRGDAAVSGN